MGFILRHDMYHALKILSNIFLYILNLDFVRIRFATSVSNKVESLLEIDLQLILICAILSMSLRKGDLF